MYHTCIQYILTYRTLRNNNPVTDIKRKTHFLLNNIKERHRKEVTKKVLKNKSSLRMDDR
jgi:hypothetical protein